MRTVPTPHTEERTVTTHRKIRLGLYGCGNRTRALLDSLYGEDEYEVVAVHDVREEAMGEVSERYGGKTCQTADELLDCGEVDAFLISLDPLAHYDAFLRTVQVGKPIFIEKPIALTAGEAYRMMKDAEERRVPVHVGLMRRYLPKHVAARKFLAEHDVGRLFSVACSWHHAGETEMINCLNNWPDNFRLKVSQIPFHCCHALDVIRLYGGEIRSVEARGLKVVERCYPSPDEVIALLEFESGAIGHFHYSSMAYRQCLTYLIHTENYTLNFENGLEIWRRPQTRAERGEFLKDCRENYHPNMGPDRYESRGTSADIEIMRDFLGSVRTGTPMKVPIADAYKVAELAEAIERSWKEKQKVLLPLELD